MTTEPLSSDATAGVAIRAKPPSPRRLSRKVLLGGALALGAVVVFALVSGLSDRRDRAGAPSRQSVAASSPPESISLAPPDYGAADLGASPVAEDGLALEAPTDDLVAPAPSHQATRTEAPPDPEAIAARAPILFEVDFGAEATSGGANATGARSSFINGQRDSATLLASRLAPPRSDYELLAGAVVPAALLTELNSDLPGRVIAQVTSPVFDSVTGRHLLIPQGARLIGAYDSATAYGDQRLLLVWNRLIMPNGWSISLDAMDGTDVAGAAGLRDRTDNHLDRLAAAIGLSAIVSVVANESEDEGGDNDDLSLSQSVGAAAAQEAARSGGRIVDRELSVRPTLRVRAGAPVRLLVTRDIRLRPYRARQ
jgi:type IV secretion system protein TrbI